ncbi:MAG: sugar transferase [Planctomycetes bacterium]|nr:sugar transferase [Planctomycetota bacterium]
MNRFYRKCGKRVFDLAVVLPAALLLLPVVAAVALSVRAMLGAGVLFRQPRGGLRGGHFMMVKFRSMLDTRDSQGELLPDDRRLTGFGKLLRSLSLDELPQLWNVMRGDMSLVGPRPLFTEYLDYYSLEQARRHDVTPGITGWAQVNGRNAISWEEKFDLDVWYVDHLSFGLDLKILWLTVVGVFARSGVNAADHATMPLFTGTKQAAAQSAQRSLETSRP